MHMLFFSVFLPGLRGASDQESYRACVPGPQTVHHWSVCPLPTAQPQEYIPHSAAGQGGYSHQMCHPRAISAIRGGVCGMFYQCYLCL